MITKGMAHQIQALQRMAGRSSYALFMEQGTGKTWALLADAERLYAKGQIDCLLVVAPNGVHTNWINREIPAHIQGNIVARAIHQDTRSAFQAAPRRRIRTIARVRNQHRCACDKKGLRFLRTIFVQRLTFDCARRKLKDKKSKCRAHKSVDEAAPLLQKCSNSFWHADHKFSCGRVCANGVFGERPVGNNKPQGIHG